MLINIYKSYPGSEVGVIPNGTGNDFCRNFATGRGFRDVISQIYGMPVKCDAIKYTSYINDAAISKIICNEASIDTFDPTVNNAKKEGYDELTKIHQTALDRYLAYIK